MHFVCKTENKMVDKSQFVGKKNGNVVVSKERVLISICYEKKKFCQILTTTVNKRVGFQQKD